MQVVEIYDGDFNCLFNQKLSQLSLKKLDKVVEHHRTETQAAFTYAKHS